MRTQLKRGNITAAVLLGVGVAGTVLDPNGPVGIPLFGVAALAALYLLQRPLRSAIDHGATVAGRPKRFRPRPLVGVVRGRTVAIIVASMSALLAVWLTADLSRPLVYAFWWIFCALAAWLISIIVLTAHRSLRTPPDPWPDATTAPRRPEGPSRVIFLHRFSEPRHLWPIAPAAHAASAAQAG
jgi:hypothetical protein